MTQPLDVGKVLVERLKRFTENMETKLMTENPLQLATKTWIEAVQKYYENEPDRNELTQVHMRGHFSGWSERQIAQLADQLAKNETDYPLWRERESK
jgi:hypothetical protein